MEKNKFHYDAFISYSHSERDSFAAEQIHKMLEHYRIPKKIQEKSGKKKIARIFRDKEELALSSDLSENIKKALQQSEYLIVVCSPRACQSIWVTREILYFLENHDRDHIFALLVEGEPEQAFPLPLRLKKETVTDEFGTEKIIEIPLEPLAADIRSDSLKGIKKRLNSEILRLLAPILCCTYDELYQRHREYKMKRTAGLLTAVAGLSIAFMLYAFHQASVVSEQYQEARRNQARYLCQISDELLDSGDRIEALKTALALTSDSSSEEPLVPQQMYALNNALYSYYLENSIYMHADRVLETENSAKTSYNVNYNAGMFSPQGNLYFTVDTLGKAYFFDCDTGECVWKLTPQDLSETDDLMFFAGAFISETEAVLVSSKEVCYIDLENQTLLHKTNIADQYNGGFSSDIVVTCTVHGNNLAIFDTTRIVVLNYQTKDVLYEKSDYSLSIKSVDINPSGTVLAIGYGDFYYQENADDNVSIRLVSLENQEEEILTSGAICSQAIQFLSDDTLISAAVLLNANISSVQNSEQQYVITAIDIASGEIKWQKSQNAVLSSVTSIGINIQKMQLDGSVQPLIFVYVKDRFSLWNPQTGEQILSNVCEDDIIGTEVFDDTRFLIASDSGSLFIGSVSGIGDLLSVGTVENSIISMEYHSEKSLITLTSESGNQVILCRPMEDEYLTRLDVENVQSIIYYDDLRTYQESDGKGKSYRIVTSNNSETDGSIHMNITVWETGNTEPLARIPMEKEGQTADQICITEKDGQKLLCYLIDEENGAACYLHTVDLLTGKEIYSGQIETGNTDSSYLDIQMTALEYTGEVVLWYNDVFAVLDAETGNPVVPFQRVQHEEESGTIWGVESSGDERYLILYGVSSTIADASVKRQVFIRLWDLEENGWFNIYGKDGYYYEMEENNEWNYQGKNITIAPETMKAAIYTEKDVLEILDLTTGNVEQRIPFYGKQSKCIAFFKNEQYLLLYGDDGHLTLWSLLEQKAVAKDAEQLENVQDILESINGEYFGVVCSTSIGSKILNLYSVDENDQFYHYADIPNGFADCTAKEIFAYGTGKQPGVANFYTYKELKNRAEIILRGQTLTETEKKMYYISD